MQQLLDCGCAFYSLHVFFFCVVFSMGQSSDGGRLCGSAALYGYNWNCGGAASHPAWPALSLCHAGPAAQVQAHAGEKLLPTGIWLHAQFLSLSHWVSCVTGPHVCPSLSQSVAASCHWMHFETLLSEGFTSSCSERRQAQVGQVTEQKEIK